MRGCHDEDMTRINTAMKPPAPATFDSLALAPTVAIPRTVHPECRDFVTQVEVLLLRRHQEAAAGVMRRPIVLTLRTG
jgi:hypothetical protein